jgi:hypothetical protein
MRRGTILQTQLQSPKTTGSQAELKPAPPNVTADPDDALSRHPAKSRFVFSVVRTAGDVVVYLPKREGCHHRRHVDGGAVNRAFVNEWPATLDE